MNKKIICSVIFIGLLCLTNLAFGQITNYGPASWTALLGGIAKAVGKLVASLGTVMIIVAGILYLTSAGSPERIGLAKKALIYAIAGIVIGLAASSIVDIVTGFMGSGSGGGSSSFLYYISKAT